MNILTKIWFYLITGLAIFASLFISVFLFLFILIAVIITVPFAFYLNWKAKKEFEKIYGSEKIKEDLKKLK